MPLNNNIFLTHAQCPKHNNTENNIFNGKHHVYSVLELAPDPCLVRQHLSLVPTHSISLRSQGYGLPRWSGTELPLPFIPPPSLKVNPCSSDSHVFLGSGSSGRGARSGQAVMVRTARWRTGSQEAEGGFRCRQNEETEEGGPHCLGCRSCRRSRDVTDCCLSACWEFLYFY